MLSRPLVKARAGDCRAAREPPRSDVPRGVTILLARSPLRSSTDWAIARPVIEAAAPSSRSSAPPRKIAIPNLERIRGLPAPGVWARMQQAAGPLGAPRLGWPAQLRRPTRWTPLRGTPPRATPLRATPLRATPLRATPLRATPLRATPPRAT